VLQRVRTQSTTATAIAVPKRLSQVSASLRPRLDAIDFLRGLVMALMVLDHARNFFGDSSMNPRDVAEDLVN
jgi:uncharacterized membrane protein